jgi:hypothetical protein
MQDNNVCWICLDDEEFLNNKLHKVCKCQKLVHTECIRKWQIYSIGKDEEWKCRFCNYILPDWRDVVIEVKQNVFCKLVNTITKIRNY